MANWAKYTQNALLGGFFALLLGPLSISAARLVAPRNPTLLRLRLPQLAGVMPEQSRPALNRQSWFDGTYQPGTAGFLGQNFPLREPLVRLNNELEYRVLRQSSANKNYIIVGKQNQLYSYDYIAEYCHLRPAVPPERLQEIATNLATLHTRLKKRGIPLVLVITPSKAATYPEYIPDQFLPYRQAGSTRSYELFVPLLKQHGIPFVDGPALIQQQKKSTRFPVYPQGGSHWTDLGALPTVRSLVEQLNRQRTTTPLPDLSYTEIAPMPPPDGEDTDLAKLLNGITIPTNYTVPYLALKRSDGAPASKKLVVVGGSFCNRLVHILSKNQIYPTIDFYFYYHRYLQQFPARTIQNAVDTAKLDWPKAIFDSDAIVLEINEEGFGETGRDTHYDTFLSDALTHIDDNGDVR
ncbi:MAG: hypothetical protein QM758_04845 [Armatimonas sp.]